MKDEADETRGSILSIEMPFPNILRTPVCTSEGHNFIEQAPCQSLQGVNTVDIAQEVQS